VVLVLLGEPLTMVGCAGFVAATRRSGATSWVLTMG
jgi:hypothetical protein